jgi:hypothetical protein
MKIKKRNPFNDEELDNVDNELLFENPSGTHHNGSTFIRLNCIDAETETVNEPIK